MEVLSLTQEPSQIVKTVLSGQYQVQILIQQKRQGLFVDVNLDGVDIVTSVIALNETPIISREYLGFPGNLLFIDLNGKDDPVYNQFNDRFNLIYLDAEEYELVRK